MLEVIHDPISGRHRPKFCLRNGHLVNHRESHERGETLLRAFQARNVPILPPHFGSDPQIGAVHTARYVAFLKEATRHIEARGDPGLELVPTITRDHRAHNYPDALAGQLEWHMFDTFSPIAAETYASAIGAARAALSAAQRVGAGQRAAYALCRPPGHHAHADFGGGFCYLNNAALAAEHLATGGRRVAILDVDADHGNGTQDIFYARGDVLHASIHADPKLSYPYFTGHADETGEGEGAGTNLNLPLPLGTGDADYLRALEGAVEAIAKFRPDYLVVALGVDGHTEEPNQLFTLSTECYARIGVMINGLRLPTVFTQEGGYNLRNLATNVLAVLSPFLGDVPN